MVEIEGKEVLDIPGMGTVKAKGPSHENGGIKLDLPVGTEIFSKRVKIDGKSAADRKEARSKRLQKILDRLSDSPFDIVTRKTMERTMETNALEEYEDLMIQGSKSTKEFKYGGKIEKYADGTPPGGIPGGQLPAGTSMVLDALLQQYQAAQGPVSPIPGIPGGVRQGMLPQVQNLPTTSITPLSYPKPQLGASIDMSQIDLQNFDDQVGGKPKGAGIAGLLGKAGASMGPLGVAVGTLGPLAATLINRAGDKKNTNEFEGYGAQGLATNSLAMGQVDANRQSTARQLDQTRVNTEGLLANNSTSSNTLRSGQQLNSANTQGAQAQVNADSTVALNQLLGQRSQMLNQRDQVVMRGRDQANVRDQQDRDQFFTNLSSNLSNAGSGMMHLARNKKRKLTIDDLLRF